MVQILAAVRNGDRLCAKNGAYVLTRRANAEKPSLERSLFPEDVKQLIEIGLLIEAGSGVLRAGPNLI